MLAKPDVVGGPLKAGSDAQIQKSENIMKNIGR